MSKLGKILEEIDTMQKENIKGLSINEAARMDLVLRKAKCIIRKHLSEDDGWIPVEERLPGNGTYLCAARGVFEWGEETHTEIYSMADGEWDAFDTIVAWQPLPSPYRTNKDD